MIALLSVSPAAGKLDAAAALRAHDAWLGEGGAGLCVVEPADPRGASAELRLDVREAETGVAPGGLARAAAVLVATGASSIEPAGFWPGGPRPPEPYATMWEFEEVAASPAGPPVCLAPEAPAAPVTLRLASGGDGSRLSTGAWSVHSFALRRAHERPEVAALVPAGCRRILEIGCAEGALGAALEKAGARVTGVEQDPDAACVAAGRLSRVVPRRLDDAWDELGDGWDTVVAADVLEHLEDPIGALRRLRERCRAGAILVASLPNASHAAVLGGALQGRWDLALEGVVADDHRTWSGGAGWRRLLSAGGWRVETAQPLPYSSPRIEPWVRVLVEAGLSEDEATAIQWLFVARAAAPADPLELSLPNAEHDAFAADPVGAARVALETTGRAVWMLPNAVCGDVLDALFAGDVAHGDARAALSTGFTAAGLVRRFRGSGLEVDVTFARGEVFSSRVSAALEAARGAGLPTDRDSLSSPRLRLRAQAAPR